MYYIAKHFDHVRRILRTKVRQAGKKSTKMLRQERAKGFPNARTPFKYNSSAYSFALTVQCTVLQSRRNVIQKILTGLKSNHTLPNYKIETSCIFILSTKFFTTIFMTLNMQAHYIKILNKKKSKNYPNRIINSLSPRS